MNVIPAQAAGVKTTCVACRTPARKFSASQNGSASPTFSRWAERKPSRPSPTAQQRVPRVDRIVGPGNIYVAAAKKLIAGETGIDFVAGPTEIVIIAAEGNPRWIAADMLAQAEHDLDASAILLTTSRSLATAVSAELDKQLAVLPTANVARPSIDNNGAIVIVDSMDQAIEISNSLAPEHLALHDASLLGSIQNAGSVFLGPSSPEAAGDYASGPNHVLPTSGQARLRGGLSAADFVKVVSVQELKPRGPREAHARDHHARPRRRPRSTRAFRGASVEGKRARQQND